MLKIIRCIVLLLVLSGAGCHLGRDWATMNNPIPIMTDIIQKLHATDGKAVKLTSAQKEELLSCLRGPVRKAFLRDTMAENVFAYWYKFNRATYKDKVYFVRYARDDKWFNFIGVDSNGLLFTSGGGMRGSMGNKEIDEGGR